jgi:hypothetical protein
LTKQPDEIDSPGRSGARMFMSHDKKYFIKSLVGPSIDASYQVSVQLTDDGHQVMAKAHIAFGKVS